MNVEVLFSLLVATATAGFVYLKKDIINLQNKVAQLEVQLLKKDQEATLLNTVLNNIVRIIFKDTKITKESKTEIEQELAQLDQLRTSS
jgi:hypothetical protein